MNAYLGELVDRLADGEELFVNTVVFGLLTICNPWTLGNGDQVVIVQMRYATIGRKVIARKLEEYALDLPLDTRGVTRRVAAAIKSVDPSFTFTPVPGQHDRYIGRRS
jgi:hypothetical protein